MGNRGGRLHRDRQDTRPAAGRRGSGSAAGLNSTTAIATVWGDGYTELFFLDEVTALAAGHRPCFECRRKDAETICNTVFAGKT